ncbi:hypothetical protein INT48_009844 [Thamnidium elegans]|uniref:Uncharacterized protein n=1 Tax=Thamnidium elegans TaxID=101142 RepID=A0A8H7SP33_9FUNG|nr:hypothetical protein INT48_009844 [Thamnidium elegans]
MSDSNVKQLTRNQEEMAPIHAFIAKNAGNTTYAAGAAALMANVIVILYIIVAIFEKPAKDDVTEEKKDN